MSEKDTAGNEIFEKFKELESQGCPYCVPRCPHCGRPYRTSPPYPHQPLPYPPYQPNPYFTWIGTTDVTTTY